MMTSIMEGHQAKIHTMTTLQDGAKILAGVGGKVTATNRMVTEERRSVDEGRAGAVSISPGR